MADKPRQSTVDRASNQTATITISEDAWKIHSEEEIPSLSSKIYQTVTFIVNPVTTRMLWHKKMNSNTNFYPVVIY